MSFTSEVTLLSALKMLFQSNVWIVQAARQSPSGVVAADFGPRIAVELELQVVDGLSASDQKQRCTRHEKNGHQQEPASSPASGRGSLLPSVNLL